MADPNACDPNACSRRLCRLTKPPAAVELMGQLKRLFDPALIMNPYKLLPPSFWAAAARERAAA